jgi:hypothetical protein
MTKPDEEAKITLLPCPDHKLMHPVKEIGLARCRADGCKHGKRSLTP